MYGKCFPKTSDNQEGRLQEVLPDEHVSNDAIYGALVGRGVFKAT